MVCYLINVFHLYAKSKKRAEALFSLLLMIMQNLHQSSSTSDDLAL